jgi:hypothetical protein
MKMMVAAGLLIGAACGLLAWSQNVPGRVSVFPDLVSLLAPALFVTLTIRIFPVVRGRPDRAAMRRAGRVLVGAGSLSFAAAHTWMVSWLLPGFPPVVTFLWAFSGFLLVGSVGIWLGLRGAPQTGAKTPASKPGRAPETTRTTDKGTDSWEMAGVARS